MNLFYALLQQQKVHLLHLPPEELQQWPGNFNRIKRTSRSAEQQGKKKKLVINMIACNKFWFWQNRPFVRSLLHVSGCEMSCRAAIFFSWNLQKNKMITIWKKVIKYLLNKFTFQGGRSVLLKGESLHLFLPRPSAMIYNVDYFWIIMHQLSVGMGHSLSISWERWVKRVYNSVILGAEESVHEWFSDESWEHRILLRTPSSRHRRCHPG